MKIALMSDSHDRLPALRAAVSRLKELGAEQVVHAGDVIAPFAAKCLTPEHLGDRPLHVIYGNNDGERAGLKKVLPQIADGPVRLELGGQRIAVAHYREWFAADDVAWADVLVSGHDHHAYIQADDGKLWINPGEVCGWLTGRCTFVMLDTDTTRTDLIDVAGGG
jgi:uncharacterized protein